MNRKIIISSLSLALASLFFVVNDAIINFLSPLNIEFYHFVFYGTPAYLSVSMYLLFTNQFKKKVHTSNFFIPILRGLIFVPMPFLAFICLRQISLPEYTTLMMSSPLFSGVLAVIFLKEKLNIYILSSLVIGFLGVIFVIQPGFDNSFNLYFLLVLLSAFLIITTNILVNKYNNITSSEGFFIYGGIPIHLICFCLFINNPILISINIFLLITAGSIMVNSAIFLNIFAFKKSQKYYASISNLIYLQILWSSIIGIIFFNEHLNNIALIGALLIILCGIISIPAQIKQLNES